MNMDEETEDVKLVGLTVHPFDNEASSTSLENPNEVDRKVFPTSSTDVLSSSGQTAHEVLQLPCGHILENPSEWQTQNLPCPKIVPKECARGHVTPVTCSTNTSSEFKCMTVIQDAPPPPSCPHQGGSLIHRKCHEVDLTLGHYLCPIMVELKAARCAAGGHPRKAPCHLTAKLNGLNSKGRRGVYYFLPCQEPVTFRCIMGLHLKSVPCHQRSRMSVYDLSAYDCCSSPSPPPPPPLSLESILDEIQAFFETRRVASKDYRSCYSPSQLLPPPSISGLEREGQDVVIGRLLDRLEERSSTTDNELTMTHVVKTSSLLDYLWSEWKYLDDEMAQLAVLERMKKIVQAYNTDIIETQTGSKGHSEEKGLVDNCNSVFRKWCGCYVKSAGVVKSKMAKLLQTDRPKTENKSTAMYELILQLSETFIQSVSENPFHSDAQFCVELVKGLGKSQMKRAVVWTLLGILATLKDPNSALEVGKCCGDVISELLDDLNIPKSSRVAGIVKDDEFLAWKTVLKNVFRRPSEMFEINYRIKRPEAKAWFRGLEVKNPKRKEFRDFYHLVPKPDEGGLKSLDVLKVEDPSTSITIKTVNPSFSTQGSVGGGDSSSGESNLTHKRNSEKHHGNTDKHKKTKI